MNRQRFLVSTIGAGTAALGAPWLTSGMAATDDELAFANFGASIEFLARDFYARALDAKVVTPPGSAVLRSGRSAATQHARALSELLAGAGDGAPVEEDFAFEWPANTFRTKQAVVTTGLGILGPLLGAYQTASAMVVEPSYRVLYASFAASVGQQVGALAWLAPRVATETFPVAIDLETATSALERYLG